MCKCANCRLCITEHLQQKALARNEAQQFKATICTFAHSHICTLTTHLHIDHAFAHSHISLNAANKGDHLHIYTFAHLHIIIDSYVSKKTTRISPPKDDQLDVHRVDGYVGAKRFE